MFGRRDARLRLGAASLLALAAAVQAACSGGTDRPAHLIDGSLVKPPPVALQGLTSPQVATKARAVGPRAVDHRSVAACLAATDAVPRLPVVSRIGVEGTSVTFSTVSGHNLVGCDGVGSAESWCGRALGRVRAGKLVDPRLDLAGCSTREGDPVAFAWVEPARRARWVAVRHDAFSEVYPVLRGDVPIRVTTTTDIDLDTSSASFEISEHDAVGRAVRAYTLQARVAG